MPQLQRSTESYGLGQSGYTAGRREADPALGIEALNLAYPRMSPEEPVDLGVDERFTGTGGLHWAPDDDDGDDGVDRASTSQHARIPRSP